MGGDDDAAACGRAGQSDEYAAGKTANLSVVILGLVPLLCGLTRCQGQAELTTERLYLG
jgi:hypothetical protein